MRTYHVKPLAHPDFHRGSLGYSRYYGFIRPKPVYCYFLHFLYGSLHFCLSLQIWFSCSLIEPKQESCRLNAVCRVVSSQVTTTLLPSAGRLSRKVAPLLILA